MDRERRIFWEAQSQIKRQGANADPETASKREAACKESFVNFPAGAARMQTSP
jgi:hypothetical protein